MAEEDTANNGNMTFWEHLDILRASVIKIVLMVVICAVAAFFFKDELFSVVLAPKDSDFIIYRLFDSLNTVYSSGRLMTFRYSL